MNRILLILLVAIFGIFVGSQITEGILIVPFWKTLSKIEFYEHYTRFGPSIGFFYTVLTILVFLIPITVSIYCYFKNKKALKYSILSSICALLFVSFFYVYFKEANQQFYDNAFDAIQLKLELETWGKWHWFRVLFESLSLFFLILSINYMDEPNISI